MAFPDPHPAAHLPDEAGIARLVHAFYARARTDWLLGPVFAAAVEDWDAHLDTLVRFWCSVLLRAGSYRAAHDVLPREQARHVFATAERIGQSLRIGLEIDPLRQRRRGDGGPACSH